VVERALATDDTVAEVWFFAALAYRQAGEDNSVQLKMCERLLAAYEPDEYSDLREEVLSPYYTQPTIYTPVLYINSHIQHSAVLGCGDLLSFTLYSIACELLFTMFCQTRCLRASTYWTV
jgi:hypothetical protein